MKQRGNFEAGFAAPYAPTDEQLQAIQAALIQGASFCIDIFHHPSDEPFAYQGNMIIQR